MIEQEALWNRLRKIHIDYTVSAPKIGERVTGKDRHGDRHTGRIYDVLADLGPAYGMTAEIDPDQDEERLTLAELTAFLGADAHDQQVVLAWTGDAVDHNWTEREARKLRAAWQGE